MVLTNQMLTDTNISIRIKIGKGISKGIPFFISRMRVSKGINPLGCALQTTFFSI